MPSFFFKPYNNLYKCNKEVIKHNAPLFLIQSLTVDFFSHITKMYLPNQVFQISQYKN